MNDPNTLPETTEDKLARLRDASARKAQAEADYAKAKADVLPDLEGGERLYFVDENGEKRYAHEVVPDMTVVNLSWAEENLPPAIYRQILKPEAANNDAIDRLIKTGKITAAQAKKLVRFVPGTKRVYVSDPQQ